VDDILIGSVTGKPKEKDERYCSDCKERIWETADVLQPEKAEGYKYVNEKCGNVVLVTFLKVQDCSRGIFSLVCYLLIF